MFGNWTFGPSKDGSRIFLHLSFFHTWITYFISVIGTLITFFLWIELSHPDDWTWEKFNGRINNVTKEADLFTPETWEESSMILSWSLMIVVLPLTIIFVQHIDSCNNFICKCCQKNCFPVIKKKELDIMINDD